jgi:hypothetical protein
MECIGIHDEYGQSAQNFQMLLEEYGMTPRHIAGAVRQVAHNSGHNTPPHKFVESPPKQGIWHDLKENT